MRITRPTGALTALLLLAPAGLRAQGVPDYSNTERAKVPEVFKSRTSDIYPTAEAWRKELAAARADLGLLEGRAKGWTATPAAMADFLLWKDALRQRVRRLYAYASLQSDLDMADGTFQSMKGEANDLAVTFDARLAFLDADLLALGGGKVAAYVAAEPRLAPYRVVLQRTLRMKDHVIPAGEERVSSLASAFSDFPGTVSGILNDVDIPRPSVTLSTGEKVTLNTATYQRYRGSKVQADRALVMATYWASQKPFENSQAALMDANVKSHLFKARVHHFDTCLEASLFPNAIDPAVYRNLVGTVRANLAPLHRLLRLRARMLGLKEMRYSDLYASAVASVNRVYTWPEAQDLVRRATLPLGPGYRQALAGALDNRWVDVFPNKGKQSGAYSSDDTFGFHPFIKMNYDGTYLGVSTLAHELGHAMHSFHSDAAQPYPTSSYPTFLAEVASTFNENLLMNNLLATDASDAYKLYVLDSYLEQVRGTLYRQTLFADFELAMHERVEQGLSLTPDWLDGKYLELTRLYYGHDAGVVKVDDWIQSEWSEIPHFYMDFYVFQYATSMAASMALTQAVLKEGEPARARYLAFLSAGSSRFPLDTLRAAGVDFATPRPVEEALKAFDGLVAEMEKIYGRMAKS